MTSPTPSDAALDDVLRRATHLILDFDGPVCHLDADQPERRAADRLRTILAQHDAEIPDAVATTADPLTVLAYAAAISPQLAEQADAELTRHEISIALAAQPAGYSHDLISSAREGNRTITIISTCSADAVRAYFDKASLDEQVSVVIGRSQDSHAGHHLIGRALAALNADPSTCALVTESADLLTSAAADGVATIAYARTLTRNVASAHPDAAITSLADLVLQLRAHPLPN